MKKFLLIALLCVSGNAGAAVESFITGNEMLSDCAETPRGMKFIYCHGYIASAYDTHNVWVEWGDLPQKFCSPDEVTQDQLRLVVVKYLEAHPAKLHLSGDSLVLNALMEAFPCTEYLAS